MSFEQERSEFLDPHERIIIFSNTRFERDLGSTELEGEAQDWFSLIKGMTADNMLSSYETTEILPDEVFDEISQDFLNRYDKDTLGEWVPFRMVGDLVGFQKNGWLYEVQRKKEKNFTDIKLAHKAIIALDIMTYADKNLGFVSRGIVGEAAKQVGDVYLRRYSTLAEFANDEEISQRFSGERVRFDVRRLQFPMVRIALRELFNAFDRDNKSYAGMF